MIIFKYDLETKELISVKETRIFNIENVISIKKIRNCSIKEIVKDYSYDYYTQASDEDVCTQIHYHKDHEIRLILEGTAEFYLPLENYVYSVKVSQLDRIDLAPEIDHWYKSYGKLTALRVFGGCDSYETFTRDYSKYNEFYLSTLDPENYKSLYLNKMAEIRKSND